MGLEPLEFAECLTDSPFFREKLHDHEKELEKTSKAIKALITDGRDLLSAAKSYGKAQQSFAQKLLDFKFECIGGKQTDDEKKIATSLKEFGKLIQRVEDERHRMISIAVEQFNSLEDFRKKHIGSVKEEKKSFDKQTAKICQSLDRYLNLKPKVNDNTLQEADAQLEMELRGFREASMKYVLKVQEVQERKKFDFVEIILRFMYSLFTFYHEGFENNNELKEYSTDLQKTLQKTRDSFESTKEQTEKYMLKMLESRGNKPLNQSFSVKGGVTKEGYLYLMEKKALGTTWTKHYCWYKKENKEFHMMPYNQINGKLIQSTTERLELTSCIRRATQSIDKRFCFDITVKDRSDTWTFQCISEADRKLWLDAMDGKEPIYNPSLNNTDDSLLDDIGFNFIKRCIHTVETRGLNEQGLYRVVGVNSKVNKLISLGLDPKKKDKISLDDPTQHEIKTITSAVKNYLRSLPEPLMTYKLHNSFISAAKQETNTLRVHDIHTLVHRLPEPNFEMLDLLMGHLKRVVDNSDKNFMTVANIGVCFGPTLMRSEEESVAAIMDIKFCNIIVEILILNYEKIFKYPPEGADIADCRVMPQAGQMSSNKCIAPVTNHTMMDNRLSQITSLHQPVYANKAPVHPSATAGGHKPAMKLRAIDVYNPSTGGFETHAGSSTSGSSDSLNSSQSNHVSMITSSPQLDNSRQSRAPVYSNVNALANRYNLMSGSDIPTFGSIKKRGSNDSSYQSSMTSSIGSMTASLTGTLMGSTLPGSLSHSTSKPRKRTVRTLYQCIAENDTELSFEPNLIIHHVRPSKEPGWLEGTLNGKTGLLPENYIEYID